MCSSLAGADTSDEIEAIERDVSPLLARHNNALYLNRTLYARLAALYAKRETLDLNAEQARVLERYHTRFVRAGAALEKPAQERLAAINERLASLGTQFGQNVLADEKSFVMLLDEGDLAGLPDFALAAARAAAEERGQPGKYAITLARSKPSAISSRRDLKRAFQAWIRRGENGGQLTIARRSQKWFALRAERARQAGLGFADYRLDDQMARLLRRRAASRRGLGQGAREGRRRAGRLAGIDCEGGRQFSPWRHTTGASYYTGFARRNLI
jgi:peptidyl-dipeptidase Dcp